MVVAYLDITLVTGKTEQEYLTNLAQVLERLHSAVMKLKREKCAFCLPQVEYLGVSSLQKDYALWPVPLKKFQSSHHRLSLSHFLALSLIVQSFCRTQQLFLTHSTSY